MNQELAMKHVSDYISEVGELTKVVSQRYEAIFSNFYSVLIDMLESASSMAEAARFAIDLADAAVETMRSNFVGQPKFACAKNCSACCHLFVAIPPGIADLIADHVNAVFAPAEREALISRLRPVVEKARSSPNPQALRARCPMLDDEGGCTIYSVRPLSCRSFTSTSRSRCEDVVFSKPHGEGGVDQNPARYRIYEYTTKALQETARKRGLPWQQQGLSSALLANLAV